MRPVCVQNYEPLHIFLREQPTIGVLKRACLLEKYSKTPLKRSPL